MYLDLDTLSFLIGFVTASIFWWLMGRMRPLFDEMRQNWKQNREEAKLRRATGVEDNHRRVTLRRAQGMHLAAPLFALSEIVEEPLILAPPPRVEPGETPLTEDIVAKTIPYMPAWPELAGIYQSPTLKLTQVAEAGVNFIITGQPGTGKTVALAYLSSLISNRETGQVRLNRVIPFFYHIADLVLSEKESEDVLEPLKEAALEHAPILDRGRLPKFIELAFSNKRALLLLDGFDEILPEEQKLVSNFLKALLKKYPGNQIITTGCPEHLDGLVRLGFEPMAIMPWKNSQQTDFIEKWGQLWMQTVAAETWSMNGDVEQVEHVDPLLINSWLNDDNQFLTPLELTLKVWAGYAGDSLGSDTIDFIATHIRRLAPVEAPLAALETLGMQVTLASQPVFDTRSAREWVKDFELPEDVEGVEPEENGETSDDEQKEEKPKTGPLRKTGPLGQKGKAGQLPGTSALLNKMTKSGLLVPHLEIRRRFLHPVFGGFLAGRALSEQNFNKTLLQQPDWIGKFLAMRYLAVYGDASSLASDMLANTKMPLHQPLFTTARWLRDAPRKAPWRGKVFAQLASILQADGNPLTLRAQATAAFCWSDDPGVGPLFRQFLATNSFELVQLAALGSGAIRDTKAVESISNILYSPSPGAQRAGALALVAIGTDAAMEAVARGLLNGEEDLRRAAAEALANDPDEGYAMLKEGTELPDILLRRAVVYGLARIDEEWATEALQTIQIEDDQWVVRNSASEVLESKNQIVPRTPQRLTPPSETPWLIEFAGKQGMGISPGSPATEILIAALKSDIDEERLAALPYLKQMPSEGVITNLYHAMYRDDPELREAIFIILCELAASGIKLPDPNQFGLG